MNDVNSRQLRGWGREKSIFRNPERAILLFFHFLLQNTPKTPLFEMKIVNPPVDTTGIDKRRQFMETRGQGWTQ